VGGRRIAAREMTICVMRKSVSGSYSHGREASSPQRSCLGITLSRGNGGGEILLGGIQAGALHQSALFSSLALLRIILLTVPDIDTTFVGTGIEMKVFYSAL